MIPFAVQSLHLTDVQGGYLFLLTALGIGTGAMIAGKISGKTIELGLVPLAGIGMTICAFALDFFSDTFYPIIPLVIILGLFGGIWQIPLDSYVQVASPNQKRGQIVAATNFLSFFGVLCASGLLYSLTELFGLKADKGFTVIGFITLGISIFALYQFFDYVTRFICMILSRLHFKIDFNGLEHIPEGPAIYVCYHQAWNETLLLLGSQRRRMRFFIEQEQDHSQWMKKLYHLLRIVSIPSIETLEYNENCFKVIQNCLNNGISVCIFVNRENVLEEIKKLSESELFCEILQGKDYPIIPVYIEQGERHHPSKFIARLLKKFRVPAEISFGPKHQGPARTGFASEVISEKPLLT